MPEPQRVHLDHAFPPSGEIRMACINSPLQIQMAYTLTVTSLQPHFLSFTALPNAHKLSIKLSETHAFVKLKSGLVACAQAKFCRVSNL